MIKSIPQHFKLLKLSDNHLLYYLILIIYEYVFHYLMDYFSKNIITF